ncbi:MAG TPA: alpha/beta hydrolase [Allosphingosinicella sp.]|jgi:pimeloyl-ACP methyl ester carboxylesterase
MSRGLLPLFCLAAAALAAPAASAPPFKLTRMSVLVRGSGPDVILIPGLAASRGIWSSTASALPGYRYHFVQVAGFAGTPAGSNSAGPVAAGVADEIARYIAARGLNRPAIVGHSMGGSIAMMVAARHPGAPGRVMVVDMLPSPARPFGVPAQVVKPLARLVGDEIQRADRLRRELRPLVARFGNANWLESRSDAGLVGRSVEELMATDLTPELRRIRAPLTVVYACSGTFRRACGPVGRAFAGAYAARPGTRLVRIERSGHTIMSDQPAAFQAALRSFLAPARRAAE